MYVLKDTVDSRGEVSITYSAIDKGLLGHVREVESCVRVGEVDVQQVVIVTIPDTLSNSNSQRSRRREMKKAERKAAGGEQKKIRQGVWVHKWSSSIRQVKCVRREDHVHGRGVALGREYRGCIGGDKRVDGVEDCSGVVGIDAWGVEIVPAVHASLRFESRHI